MSQSISIQLKFFIQLAKIQSKVSRSFDYKLNGISFTEFIILHHLNKAKDKKLRRIDLAEKVGLTASGITRLILPMEKIGLVGRGSDERDARVKFVTLTDTGKEKFIDELVYANNFANSQYPETGLTSIEQVSKILELIH